MRASLSPRTAPSWSRSGLYKNRDHVLPAPGVNRRRKRAHRQLSKKIAFAVSCRSVFLEPLLQAFPTVLRGFFVIAGTVVGIETVARFGIHHDLRRIPGGLERRAHL